jgi:hypothetical protein
MSPAFCFNTYNQEEWNNLCQALGLAPSPVPENKRTREPDIETDSHAEWRRANLGTDC